MRRLKLAAGLFAALLALPALADPTPPPGAPSPGAPPPPPQRMKGTIAAYDQATQMLSLTTADHKTVSIALQSTAGDACMWV